MLSYSFALIIQSQNYELINDQGGIKMNYKKIHIGESIKYIIEERQIDIRRIISVIKCTEEELQIIYKTSSIDTEILLKFCKVCNHDFFRLYSQHIILYAPLSKYKKTAKVSSQPSFRKNLYTKEIIDFVLEQLKTEKMTKNEVIEKYKIPKTTLYKWLSKYKEE